MCPKIDPATGVIAANWVSFDLNVAYSSCWGYSFINTLKLKNQENLQLEVFLIWYWSLAKQQQQVLKAGNTLTAFNAGNTATAAVAVCWERPVSKLICGMGQPSCRDANWTWHSCQSWTGYPSVRCHSIAFCWRLFLTGSFQNVCLRSAFSSMCLFLLSILNLTGCVAASANGRVNEARQGLGHYSGYSLASWVQNAKPRYLRRVKHQHSLILAHDRCSVPLSLES